MDGLTLSRDGLSYHARAYPAQLGRLRATVKVERDSRFHVDTLDLYSSRSRTEFARRAAKALTGSAETRPSGRLRDFREPECDTAQQ